MAASASSSGPLAAPPSSPMSSSYFSYRGAGLEMADDEESSSASCVAGSRASGGLSGGGGPGGFAAGARATATGPAYDYAMKRAAAEGVYGQGRPVLGVDHGPPPWGKEGEGEADRPSAPECKRLDRTAFPSESQGASKSEQHPKEQDASAEGEGVQSWQPPKEATAVPASLFLTRSLGDEEDDDTYQDNGKDQSSPGDRVGDGEVPQPGRRSSEKGDCYDEEEQEERYEEAEDDYDEDFIKTFLDHAVDAPCQRLAVAPCVADLMDRQMDLFMRCRQPLEFLSMFREPGDDDGDFDSLDKDVAPYHQQPPSQLLPGAYVLPSFCEYCGSPSLDECDPVTCPRPRLYFAKRRPPFAKSSQPSSTPPWDAKTDDALEQPPVLPSNGPIAADNAAHMVPDPLNSLLSGTPHLVPPLASSTSSSSAASRTSVRRDLSQAAPP